MQNMSNSSRTLIYKYLRTLTSHGEREYYYMLPDGKSNIPTLALNSIGVLLPYSHLIAWKSPVFIFCGSLKSQQ